MDFQDREYFLPSKLSSKRENILNNLAIAVEILIFIPTESCDLSALCVPTT